MSKYAGINNAQITSGQIAKILFLFSLGSAALLLPTAVTSIAKQDSWISMLLAGPFNYLVLMIYLALMDRFPRLSLAQYAEKLLGVWLGKALAICYIFFLLILSSLVLRNISDFLGLSVLPITPEWFINLTFMIVVVYGVMLGIETIARTGEILFGWSIVIMIVLVCALLSQFSMDFFEPVLFDGVMRPIKGLYPILGFPIGEFIFITMVLPQVREQDRSKLRRHLKLAALLITVAGTLLVICLIGVMGVDETIRSPFAIYDMAKYINIEEILVRVEIMVAVVWIGTVFMKLSLCVYTLTVMTAQVLKLTTYRPLVVPYAFIILPMAILTYRNAAHSNEFAMGVWSVYSVTFGYLVPLLLLLVAVIRKKRDYTDGSFPPIEPLPQQAGGKNGPPAGAAEQEADSSDGSGAEETGSSAGADDEKMDSHAGAGDLNSKEADSRVGAGDLSSKEADLPVGVGESDSKETNSPAVEGGSGSPPPP
jgi:spore germination protein KB